MTNDDLGKKIILSMEEKEELFKRYQNGDYGAMELIVESHFPEVADYVLHFSSKHENVDTKGMVRYINSMLFRRMQICTSIFSYEKDVNKFIQREALRYMKRIRIVNSKEQFDFINLEIDEKILRVLHDSLDADVYYVFYQMVSGVEIGEIGDKLGIGLLDVKKRYVAALEMLETFLSRNEKRLKRRLYSIKEREGNKSERIKIEPYSSDSIIIYFYLKDRLSSKEQKLYYYQIFSNYEYYNRELQVLLKVDENELADISDGLNRRIKAAILEDEYGVYRRKMLDIYGPYLYNLVKSENTKRYDFASIREIANLLSFEDIRKFLSDDVTYLTPREKKLLYKYYYKNGRYTAEVEDVERDVNLNIFGYKQKKTDIMPMKYYKVYLENLDSFDEVQRLFLECYFFKVRDKKEFLEKYPNSSLYYRYYTLTLRLEKLYYNINNYTDNSFNKEKWLSVRDRYREKHSEERVKLLDMFYGVEDKAMSIKEIALLYPELTYIKVHDLVSDARDAAINVYINKKHKIEIVKEDYIPYLDMKYEYTDETREILKMFIVENLDYEEISKRTGLNKTRISNIITDGIRKIDHYRLDVLRVRDINEDVLRELYVTYPDYFDSREKKIHRFRFVKGVPNVMIAQKLGMDKKDVNHAMVRLYRLHERYLIKDVTISKEMVSEEVNRHFTDRVVSERTREILALYYGVKCDVNIEGEKLDAEEIQERLKITRNVFHHVYDIGIDNIKLRSIGELRPELQVFTREELVTILEDRHLPISDKEREIINSLWNINGEEYRSLDVLAKDMDDLPTSIRRRYYRAIVSIKRYLNGELEEQINYEEDIVPILKYFSRSDRIFIYEYYKNNVSYKNLAKKYKMTSDMVLAVLNRIKIMMYEMMHSSIGNVEKLFDFDYYYEAIDNPDLPFYGDLGVARQIFELYFGMNEMRRLSIPEIKERLNLDIMNSAMNNAVYSLMISVCKLKEGVKKQREFTYGEIKDYYMRHKTDMDSVHLVYYDRYFKKMLNRHDINGRVTKVSKIITYDLLKEQGVDLFKLETASNEQIERILKDDNYILDSKTRHVLHDKISPFGELDGRDINHVYRIINSLLERNLLFVDRGKSYRLKIEEQ